MEGNQQIFFTTPPKRTEKIGQTKEKMYFMFRLSFNVQGLLKYGQQRVTASFQKSTPYPTQSLQLFVHSLLYIDLDFLFTMNIIIIEYLDITMLM